LGGAGPPGDVAWLLFASMSRRELSLNGSSAWISGVRRDPYFWGTYSHLLRQRHASMRLKRVRIQNFRCLEDTEIFVDNVTTFIGPNGVGKSSVLRGLDWFFNGERSLVLTEEDICHRASERRIRIEAEFDSLTPDDRAALGKYAPASSDRDPAKSFMRSEAAVAFAAGRGRGGGWRPRCWSGRPGAGC
jgi:hypothetical protein